MQVETRPGRAAATGDVTGIGRGGHVGERGGPARSGEGVGVACNADLAHSGRMPLFTFGHGTADRDELVKLLSAARIRELVDVRAAPGSRRNPDVAREEMARYERSPAPLLS
ncbi:MAG: DUF488 domain-containing protein [Actinomycetota bacterium]|nr:DUF488 domain-containing protein [Actinomycetota bacterium]